MLYLSESEIDLAEQSSLSLAFLGDSVLELLARQRLVQTTRLHPGQLHAQAVRLVSAKGQARAVQAIRAAFTPEEEAVFRRGKNSNKATASKNATLLEYRTSTGLEALFGYLYLTGSDGRICELFDLAWAAVFDRAEPEPESESEQ